MRYGFWGRYGLVYESGEGNKLNESHDWGTQAKKAQREYADGFRSRGKKLEIFQCLSMDDDVYHFMLFPAHIHSTNLITISSLLPC